MNKLRELFSDTVIYGLSSVLARFFNYLLVPFHTGVFASSAYGVVSLVYSAIAFLNVVFTFGMESAYFRYAEDREKSSSVYKTIQIALLGFASAMVFMLWLGKPFFMPLMSLGDTNAEIYLLMLGILWFDTLSVVPFAELRLTRRAWLYATLRIVHVLINVGLNFYLILSLNYGIEAVFLANLVATMFVTVLVWLSTRGGWKGSYDKGVLKTCLQFGWPFVFSGIGHVTNEMLDRFFLNDMDPDTVFDLYGAGLTPEDIVGIYSACYKLAVFMLLLVQMFRMAWQPFFMRHFRDENSSKLFGQAFIWFNGFSGVVFLGVALFRDQIVRLNVPILNRTIIDSEYWAGLDIVPLLLLAYWFFGWYINFSSGVFIKEKTNVLYKITLTGGVITVITNITLIPYYGMYGAATATLLSYTVMALILGNYSKKVMYVPYRLPESSTLVALLGGIVFLEPAFSSLIGMAYAKALVLIAGLVILAIYMVMFVDMNIDDGDSVRAEEL